MEFDDSSMIGTPPGKEPVMEYSLLLTALSGETFQVSLSVAKFDRFAHLQSLPMHTPIARNNIPQRLYAKVVMDRAILKFYLRWQDNATVSKSDSVFHSLL